MVSVKTNIGATCLDKDFFLPAWYNPGMKSQLTTLCYIEKNGSYLMLHRVKKQNDINQDKWIGVGGHFEHQESPEDCLLR